MWRFRCLACVCRCLLPGGVFLVRLRCGAGVLQPTEWWCEVSWSGQTHASQIWSFRNEEKWELTSSERNILWFLTFACFQVRAGYRPLLRLGWSQSGHCGWRFALLCNVKSAIRSQERVRATDMFDFLFLNYIWYPGEDVSQESSLFSCLLSRSLMSLNLSLSLIHLQNIFLALQFEPLPRRNSAHPSYTRTLPLI